MPFYLCVKDKARLEKFTKRFNSVFYFFVSILIIPVFLAINLIFLPFAYLKTIWHKITLAKADIIPVTAVFYYVLFGLFKGLIVQVPDLWAFIKVSWSNEKTKNSDATFVIDRKAFEMFYKIVVDFEQKGSPILAFDLISYMKDVIDIGNEIRTAIYGVDVKARRAREADKAPEDQKRKSGPDN